MCVVLDNTILVADLTLNVTAIFPLFVGRGFHRFKEAVAGVLAKDGEADLTFMVADYLSYSTRVRRT